MSEEKKLPTYLRGLDHFLEGGLMSNCLYMLYGPPGSGKTFFMLNMVAEQSKRGYGSIYMALDNDPDMIKKRLEKLGCNLDLFDVVDVYSWRYKDKDIIDINNVPVMINDLLEKADKLSERAEINYIFLDSLTTLWGYNRIQFIFKFLENLGKRKYLDKYNCSLLAAVDEGAHSRYDESMVEVLFQGNLVFAQEGKNRYFSIPLCYNVHPTFNIEYEISDDGMVFYAD